MNGDFRSKAAALRHAAADPGTDFRLAGLMIETAADMEAVADLIAGNAKSAQTLPDRSRPHHASQLKSRASK
jgi:hypothetical protein